MPARPLLIHANEAHRIARFVSDATFEDIPELVRYLDLMDSYMGTDETWHPSDNPAAGDGERVDRAAARATGEKPPRE